MNKTVGLLYEEADFLSLLAKSSAIVEQRKGALMFGSHLCPNNDDQHCLLSIMKVQNFLSMVLKLKIQEKLVEGNVFFGSSSVTVEQSSGTSLCISIDPSKEGYKSQSGIGNGIEAIIDLETFDNGDTQIVGDGADVLVTQSEEYPLAQLKGFSVGPGSAVEVHIQPSLYSITEKALKFDYLRRKCAEPSVDVKLNNLEGMVVNNYSLSNCLVAATNVKIIERSIVSSSPLSLLFYRCPGVNSTQDILTAKGKALQCINLYMNQVTQECLQSHLTLEATQVGAGEDHQCLSSCTRQENHVAVSSYSFPNQMFLNSYDIVQLIKKLFQSCSTTEGIYGPKRSLLDHIYPNLCPFFDKIDPSALNTERKGYFSFEKAFENLKMSDTELDMFKRELMVYASQNLVKINAFIDSPYISKYQTDEVSLLSTS